MHFLPLFRFPVKTFDLFYSTLWILVGPDPRDRIKKFIETKVQSFCLLEQTLFPIYLCVFLHWLPIMNPKSDENTPVLKGIQAKYVSRKRVKIDGLLLLITSSILTTFTNF